MKKLLLSLTILILLVLFALSLRPLNKPLPYDSKNINLECSKYRKTYKLTNVPSELLNLIVLDKGRIAFCEYTFLGRLRSYSIANTECRSEIYNNVIRDISENRFSKGTNSKLTPLIIIGVSINYSKEQVLEYFINNFKFEKGIYGFPMASYYYFNKPLEELSQEEQQEIVVNMYSREFSKLEENEIQAKRSEKNQEIKELLRLSYIQDLIKYDSGR